MPDGQICDGGGSGEKYMNLEGIVNSDQQALQKTFRQKPHYEIIFAPINPIITFEPLLIN